MEQIGSCKDDNISSGIRQGCRGAGGGVANNSKPLCWLKCWLTKKISGKSEVGDVSGVQSQRAQTARKSSDILNAVGEVKRWLPAGMCLRTMEILVSWCCLLLKTA